MRQTSNGLTRQFDAGGNVTFQLQIGENQVNVRSFFQERHRALECPCGKNLMPLLLQIGFGKNPDLLLVLDD